MTPERWQQVKSALDRAMALSGEQRAAFLQGLDESDSTLRTEVESLLEADQAAGSWFLETPAPAAIGFGEPEDRMVGRRLGQYEIVALIGYGGLGGGSQGSARE